MPGDVIATGTPAGIGPLKAGDVVEVEIEGVGVLRNFCDSVTSHKGS
jgi:2-keto-4-pentenoate hydratase/2-oxohepta-3-ene-1,7-dioic acid hydratase in catechol pathway